jgi:hypothetical protein
MPNLIRFERPRPNLKPKPPDQLSLLPEPQPPTVHRPPPDENRAKNTLTATTVRGKNTLLQAIDYDALSPTKQAKWDLGLFGSIELKTIKGFQYYYLRWKDPNGSKHRSTYLGKTWAKAIDKLKTLTGH